MLKMYHRSRHQGGTPEYWEQNWRETSLDETVRFCAVDPLRPFFEQHVKPGDLMLEGGCGVGQYVTYYAERGVRAVGLDFEQVALLGLHASRPSLPLCAGDVARLPFRDQSFDCYYSGGIVEHFEGGAEKALREARRVLRGEGILLITVPYFSPLKRLLAPFFAHGGREVTEARVDCHGEDGSKGLTFFQYAYKVSEFKSQLTDAGFRVILTRGFSILWGLYELPLLRSLIDLWRTRQRSRAPGSSARSIESAGAPGHGSQNGARSVLRRLAVSEDVNVPLLGWTVRALAWGCASMMLYVCVPAKQ